MKKQVRKITKKILILSLATSLVFTSCFSHKKIEVKAASIAATLSAFTLYDICLYVGGLAVSALGIGYAYENRDEIAEFGKTVIDSMEETVPETGWMIGSYAGSESCIYGVEVFEAVQDVTWDYIAEGGLLPSVNMDLTGDGLVDISDKDFELENSNFWTTSDGVAYISSHVQSIYDKWMNREEDNILDNQYGVVDAESFEGYEMTADGYYCGYLEFSKYNEGVEPEHRRLDVVTTEPPVVYFYKSSETSTSYKFGLICNGTYIEGGGYQSALSIDSLNNGTSWFKTNLPILGSKSARDNYVYRGELTDILNLPKSFRVVDWISDNSAWMDALNEIAVSLRSLADVTDIALDLANTALELTATADIYQELVDEAVAVHNPSMDVVANPTYWPETNTAPKIDAADLPNAEVANPDIPAPDGPGNEDPDTDIDLDGLLSLFNILFYIIMILIMLIYLFLACLAFIVMIFRIPASSSMLPPEMVMGFEHLNTIMIPGMNISIYGFAKALVYMLIIFAVIRALRLEINDFKIPRSFKK